MASSIPVSTSHEAAQKVADHRNSPLLVLFWPDTRDIQEEDVRDIRKFIRKNGLSRRRKIEALDVLLETTGGSGDSSYLIGQMFHDYAEKIDVLVPNKAYSAGTVLCLAGTKIIMGEDATLSPIDSNWDNEEGGKTTVATVHLLTDLAERMEDKEGKASVIKSTLGRMDPAIIADMHRETRLLEQHARKLLSQHMLQGADDDMIDEVVSRLTTETPSHESVIDYHLAKEFQLKVKRMDEDTSDLTKNLCRRMEWEILVGERSDNRTGESLYMIYTVPEGYHE